MQAPAIHLAERQGAANARATLVASEADGKYLAALGVPRVHTVPNAVHIPTEPAPVPAESTLLFLGSYNYPPNLAAVTWLVGSIWPLIKARVPHAKLLIAGQPADALPDAWRSDSSIAVLGFVPDLAALYARTRVVCCPIRTGSGTRIKLIEAAAYGKPMVSTTIGAEGLGLQPGKDIAIADSASAFAIACSDLLTSDTSCRHYGAAARGFALQHFDARMIEQRIYDLIAEAAVVEKDHNP
jgi:glycosyltransferase involved in cell wall biosynthesis